jgi:serine protease Do
MVSLSDLSTEQISEIVKVPSSVTQGVVVNEVQSSTPADQAGLKKYDVITKIDDKEVSSGVELQSELYKHKVGDTVKITFYRKDKKETTSVKLSIDSNSLKTAKNQQGNN